MKRYEQLAWQRIQSVISGSAFPEVVAKQLAEDMRQARKEALEQAAKACERAEGEWHSDNNLDAASAAALCAVRIRALAGRKED